MLGDPRAQTLLLTPPPFPPAKNSPCGEYLYNFSNTSLVEWWLLEHMGVRVYEA